MDAPKLLGLAVAILVTVVVISSIMRLRSTGEQSNRDADVEYQESLLQVDAENLNKYVNTKIYGSEVKYLLGKYTATFQLQTTKSAETSTPIKKGTGLADFVNINNATDTFYVDQSMLFDVTGIYGKNEQLIGLAFKEVRYK